MITLNWNNNYYNPLKSIISNGIVSSLIVVVVLPLYIGLLRHRTCNYIPGALKRIGLGMAFIFLSALCTLSLDTYGHNIQSIQNTTSCFLTLKYNNYDSIYIDSSSTILGISSYFLMIQCILNSVGYMLFYISTFEFICAQSPWSVREVLICSFFAIKGIF